MIKQVHISCNERGSLLLALWKMNISILKRFQQQSEEQKSEDLNSKKNIIKEMEDILEKKVNEKNQQIQNLQQELENSKQNLRKFEIEYELAQEELKFNRDKYIQLIRNTEILKKCYQQLKNENANLLLKVERQEMKTNNDLLLLPGQNQKFDEKDNSKSSNQGSDEDLTDLLNVLQSNKPKNKEQLNYQIIGKQELEEQEKYFAEKEVQVELDLKETYEIEIEAQTELEMVGTIFDCCTNNSLRQFVQDFALEQKIFKKNYDRQQDQIIQIKQLQVDELFPELKQLLVQKQTNLDNYSKQNEFLLQESTLLKNNFHSLLNIVSKNKFKIEQLETDIQSLHNIIIQFIEYCKKTLQMIQTSIYSEKPKEFKDLNKEFIELRSQLGKKIDKEFENDQICHEQLPESLETSVKKSPKSQKIFYVPRLQYQNSMNTINQVVNSGWQLVQKFSEQSPLLKKKDIKLFSRKQVLKQISQLYDERINASVETLDIDMPVYTFNSFLNKYGMKNMAETKFILLMLSAKNYQEQIRINLFCRLLNIENHQLNYSKLEMKKFFTAYSCLTKGTLGTNVPFLETDLKRYVPYLRCLEFLKCFNETGITNDEMTLLRKELEEIKEIDKSGVNPPGIVNIDLFLEKVLQKYRHVIMRTKEYVKHAFYASDLDGDGRCSLLEFLLLSKHIEKDKFEQNYIIKLFDTNADIYDGNDKHLSFEKFTTVCVDNQFFLEKAQNQFLNIFQTEQITQKFNELKIEWVIKHFELKQKLQQLQGHLESDVYENWMNIITTIDERIKTENLPNCDQKPILIAFKVLNDEFDHLLEEKAEDEKENDEENDI